MTKKKTALFALVIMGVAVLGLGMAVYAKYIASIEGKAASASVAKWAFKEENEEAELSCPLYMTYNPDTLAKGKIAPGTKGTCEIELSNNDSEVGVNYTITVKEVSGPKNLVFTYKGAEVSEDKTISGKLKIGETKKISINWAWPYYTNDTDDAEDSIDGRTAAGNATTGTKEMTVVFDVLGEQTKPTKAPAEQQP